MKWQAALYVARSVWESFWAKLIIQKLAFELC